MNSLAPYPMLQHKLKALVQALLKQPFHNKYSCPRSNLAILTNLDINLSRRYRIKNRELLDTAIGVAPSYHTRIRDGLAVRPSQRDFTNAYNILRLPTITSKTCETAFQILNRTHLDEQQSFQIKNETWPLLRALQKGGDHGTPFVWIRTLFRAAMEQTGGGAHYAPEWGLHR